MALFSEIKEIRLTVDDPSGFIDLLEAVSLPAEPASQTAYKKTSNGNYYSTEKLTGAIEPDYSIEVLIVSDSRISTWIDSDGSIQAIINSLITIKSNYVRQAELSKSSGGADDTTWIDFKKKCDAYQKMIDYWESEKRKEDENSTGIYSRPASMPVAGGEV